ncbi:MAG: GyrI-like domain-containing protein [Verrucomicrobiota bacterium]
MQIEQWPDLTPICLRFYCRVEQLQEAWSETILLLNGHVPNLERARFFGLWFDGWTHPDPEEGNYRYECAILPQDPVKGELPAPVFRRQLPGGLVAVSHAHGSTQQIETHWETFGYGWLPFSGFQPRGEIAGIDEYPADLILASKAKQALALVKGMSMRLNLPIQQEILNY